MRAIIGLGNPGLKYKNTRHNIGFRIVEHLGDELKVSFKAGKGDYYFSEAEIEGQRTLLVKPVTYMNRSGQAVKHLIRYFPLETEDLLIVYDDFHLPFGTLRFRRQGSDGGHNGIKSIIENLGTQEFARCRAGIGSQFDDSVSFVLSNFSRVEQKKLTEWLPIITDGIRYWVAEDIEAAMNKFNRAYI